MADCQDYVYYKYDSCHAAREACMMAQECEYYNSCIPADYRAYVSQCSTEAYVCDGYEEEYSACYIDCEEEGYIIDMCEKTNNCSFECSEKYYYTEGYVYCDE